MGGSLISVGVIDLRCAALQCLRLGHLRHVGIFSDLPACADAALLSRPALGSPTHEYPAEDAQAVLGSARAPPLLCGVGDTLAPKIRPPFKQFRPNAPSQITVRLTHLNGLLTSELWGLCLTSTSKRRSRKRAKLPRAASLPPMRSNAAAEALRSERLSRHELLTHARARPAGSRPGGARVRPAGRRLLGRAEFRHAAGLCGRPLEGSGLPRHQDEPRGLSAVGGRRSATRRSIVWSTSPTTRT